jgi:putative transposase
MGRRSKPKQLELAFKSRGGLRRGAGRKRKGPRARVAHCARAEHDAKLPSFVTLRVREGLPSLRRREAYLATIRAFAAGKQRFGFRLVLYSLQSNHMHLMVEAEDRRALSRGLKGLQVRVARTLNRVWNRKGPVFEYSYHERKLSTPREVRNALVYLLNNARKHGIHTFGPDPCSSGAWFDGWRGGPTSAVASPVTVLARTWLLKTGWRRHGLLDVRELPGCRRRSRGRKLPPGDAPGRVDLGTSVKVTNREQGP